MANDVHDALTGVGPRLRHLRTDRQLTLGEVSSQTGVSVSTLSRLESGARRPTLELLLPLAGAYGVSLDELVDAPPTGDPRVNLRAVRQGDRTIIPLSRRAVGIQAFKTVIPAGAHRAAKPKLNVHEGYEWLYVLDGRLRLLLADRDMTLHPGEAAEFDTRVPHAFGPADEQAVEFLSLFGKQGERAHVRARPKPS